MFVSESGKTLLCITYFDVFYVLDVLSSSSRPHSKQDRKKVRKITRKKSSIQLILVGYLAIFEVFSSSARPHSKRDRKKLRNVAFSDFVLNLCVQCIWWFSMLSSTSRPPGKRECKKARNNAKQNMKIAYVRSVFSYF